MDWGGILAPVCDWTLENGNGAVPGKIDKGYTTSNWANMVLNKQAVRECAALAHLFRDQLVLGFFGFVAPKINNSPDCKWRRFCNFVPKVWLKPKKLNGLRLLIDPADWSQTVIFEEIFLRSSYDLRKVTFTPSVIIDCGAHIGLFSLLSKSVFPNATVIAYEPNPVNAFFIRNQISRNKIDVTFYQLAVSTESKELNFVAINSHGGRLEGHGTDGCQSDTAPVYEVEVIDFCAAVKDIQPESLLLKMDVEGEERNLLPALVPVLPRQTALFFETHAGEAGWREAEQLLLSTGFEVENINARGLYYEGFACRGAV
jgi:FkbM family methyltransferase